MRIRHDVVFVSCVLFTIALVCFIPPEWDHVQAGYGTTLHGMERAYVRSDSDVGKLSLALVFIGLIVTWTEYLNKARWTWFVMFVLASGLAIPLGILPFVVHPQWVVEEVSNLIFEAAGKNPLTAIIPRGLVWRGFFYPISIFLLIVIALVLPVKSFFFKRTGPTV